MESPQELNVYFVLFAGTVGMFIMGMGILVFVVIYQKRLQLQQQTIWNMKEEFQKDLLRSNIETQEKERIRIARDLHDNVGASLATLKLFTGNLIANVIPEKKELASETLELIDQTLDEVRSISYQLLPPGLKEFGICDALDGMCRRLSTNAGIDFTVQSSGWTSKGFETDIALFRVLQELISNTIRHSGATEAKILLGNDGSETTIKYCDNGCGFDPLLMKQVKSLGLKNIYSRISVLGGTIDHRYYGQQMETLIKL